MVAQSSSAMQPPIQYHSSATLLPQQPICPPAQPAAFTFRYEPFQQSATLCPPQVTRPTKELPFEENEAEIVLSRPQEETNSLGLIFDDAPGDDTKPTYLSPHSYAASDRVAVSEEDTPMESTFLI